MRKLSGLVVVVGLVLAPLALAQAATEVVRLPANNKSAQAIPTAPDGTSTGVFVTRVLTQSGGPVDSIFFIVSRPDELIALASGVLPRGAFHIDAHSASLDVDLNAITLDVVIGTIPANGVISVDWSATDVQRMSGSVQFNFDTTHVVIAGTRTDVVADVAASVFGAPLVDPSGSFATITQSLIIVTRD